MNYICRDCNYVFNTPKRYKERHGLESPPYETMQCCPKCGGSYTAALECDRCGNYFAADEMHSLLGDYLCEECFKNEGGDPDAD